jgi:hypothetical protein
MSDDLENEDLERRLRQALKPVDPGQGFARDVMARIDTEPSRAVRPRRTGAVVSWLSLALAASVVLAVMLVHQQQARRLEQGREARRQLYEALKVTDEKLNLA